MGRRGIQNCNAKTKETVNEKVRKKRETWIRRARKGKNVKVGRK